MAYKLILKSRGRCYEYFRSFGKKQQDCTHSRKEKIFFVDLLDQGLRFGGYMTSQGIQKGDDVLMFVSLSIYLYKAMIGAKIDYNKVREMITK